jgi:hypothetical protein
MYLLVLAFTFVYSYYLIISFLYLLSLFTYYVQIPFINRINKIFKIPYFFNISYENLFYKDTEKVDSSEEKSNDQNDSNIKDNLSEEKTNNNVDEDTEDEELNKKLTDIEDFIEIRKNKFLIDESLD